MIFDEASSWWSTDHITLPDSRELELELQEKMSSDVVSEPVLEEPAEPCLEKPPNQAATSPNPWRSGVHQIKNAEQMRPSQLNEPENEDSVSELRRSSRTRKSNSRYANFVLIAALVVTTDEADSIYEPVSLKKLKGYRFGRKQYLKKLKLSNKMKPGSLYHDLLE